jgi:RNA polymerase sigma-70 factor (ECF subfamily)
MTEDAKKSLRTFFLSGYADLVKTVTRKLGSRERAEDALHDAYLRLERTGEISALQSPRAYLVRMALNIATDNWRAESRTMRGPAALRPQTDAGAALSISEGDALLNAVDESPDAERVAVARSEMRRLETILAELPERRRAIFEAVWVEGLSHEEAVRRFGISLRSVQQELKLAREYCAKRLGVPS